MACQVPVVGDADDVRRLDEIDAHLLELRHRLIRAPLVHDLPCPRCETQQTDESCQTEVTAYCTSQHDCHLMLGCGYQPIHR